MITNYTPGPWYCHRHGGPNLYSADGTEIGHINYVDDGYLIAAAPDLLGALELILTAEERGFGADYIKACARSAIAKAKGETK